MSRPTGHEAVVDILAETLVAMWVEERGGPKAEVAVIGPSRRRARARPLAAKEGAAP